MPWEVKLFESDRGEKFVEKVIKVLDSATQAKVIHAIDLLEKHGFRLGMPHTKQITKAIYELRIRGKVEIRIFYTFDRAQIILLHAYKKKSQKLPEKELKVALQRYQRLS